MTEIGLQCLRSDLGLGLYIKAGRGSGLRPTSCFACVCISQYREPYFTNLIYDPKKITLQWNTHLMESYCNYSQQLTESSLNVIEECVIRFVHNLSCNLYPNRDALHCYEILGNIDSINKEAFWNCFGCEISSGSFISEWGHISITDSELMYNWLAVILSHCPQRSAKSDREVVLVYYISYSIRRTGAGP